MRMAAKCAHCVPLVPSRKDSRFQALEGNAAPIDLYRPELDNLDEEIRSSFLGDNAAECFARMGDPL